jgi:isochorismate pyruvate lyase
MKKVQPKQMDSVRETIDKLDRLLVELIGQRITQIEQAAFIKGDRNLIIDEWRIEDVITKVRAAAETHYVNPNLVEKVWRVLIDESIKHEFDVYDSSN